MSIFCSERISLKPRSRSIPFILGMVAFRLIFSSSGAEYEINGKITQTIASFHDSWIGTTNEFTIYARDCAWLIQTREGDGNGHTWQREVGSNNGTEIYEANGGQAFVSDNGIPVERLDKGVDGHLWLMFASQCFWPKMKTDKLTPVYDWQASAGVNPSHKVTAEWELLNGPGSLPREVRYLGEWGQTNALYRVVGTISVGGMPIPAGIIFEEYLIGPIAPNSYVHEMKLRKHMEAQITSVRPICSRKNLMPVRTSANTVIVDWRLPRVGNHFTSYKLSDTQKWLSIEEARKIAPPIVLAAPAKTVDVTQRRRRIVLALLCLTVLLGPSVMVYRWNKSRRPSTIK